MKSFIALLLCIAPLFAEIASGNTAPAFTLKNQDGVEVSLGDYKGKVVILEWVNFGCPFVRKFYDGGEMQRLQAQAKKDGVVWLSINSSAEGKQGYYDAAGLKSKLAEEKAVPEHYLLDTKGDVGRSYGAKVTPHLYVINAEGILVYQGAIDSLKSTKASDIPLATNYVLEALKAIAAGKPMEPSSTAAYGCGVKY